MNLDDLHLQFTIEVIYNLSMEMYKCKAFIYIHTTNEQIMLNIFNLYFYLLFY